MKLEAMRQEAELQFHRLRAMKEQAELQVKDLERQLAQVQGRHAVLTELIAQEKVEEPKPDAPSEGNNPN